MTSLDTATPAPPRAQGEPAVVARGIGHRFGDKVALQDGVSLELPRGGGVVGLLGPNGSGKSTLMRLLLGLVPLQKGEIRIDGVPLTGDGLAVRRRATYAPGELHLYGELAGRAMLAYLVRGRGRDARRRAEGIATDLGLPLERRVRGYSHGMKRQLLFAAALAPDVPVRILDEISEGLDPSKRSDVLGMLEDDARKGTAILLSSHHLGEVDRACERIVFLNDGRIIADETAEEVARRAARIVVVVYADEAEARAAASIADDRAAGAASCDVNGEGRARFHLSADDPLPLVAALGARTELARPRSIEFGQVSLRELYASLYGAEGT
ncbi:MAG: ABC transporter ATP-binding protein [Planctomycetota bacterium]